MFAAPKVRNSHVSTIVIDGLNEEDFRRSIENRLREGQTGAAVERLRALLAPYAGPGGILPERFLTVDAADLILTGWDRLGDAVRGHDAPGRPVTAISIAFGWPGEEVPEPDPDGRLRPFIETGYFSDNAYPFSQSERDDLLAGCSSYGCPWSGDAEATDNALSLEGIEDLHGALASLEARLLASDEPDEEGIRAGSLGSCLLSALLFQAVANRIADDGLPRPLCVMAGSSGVYPYFDAPVVGMPEGAIVKPDEEAEFSARAPAPRYSSLLMTEVPRARKRAVLVLDESADETANRLARLRGQEDSADGYGDIRQEPMPVVAEPDLPEIAPPTAGAEPLLARKSPKKSFDFRDMLSPSKPAAPSTKTPDANVVQAAAPLLPACDEAPAAPGFTLLEADLQQRLQNLISGKILPTADLAWSEPPAPDVEPTWNWPDEPESDENGRASAPPDSQLARAAPHRPPPGLHARMRAWLLGKFGGLLARLGL